MSRIFLLLFLCFSVSAQTRLETQNSLRDCGPSGKHEPICESIGCNELITAAENGDLNRVREQLEKGVDVNARSGAGHTALMLAAHAGHFDVVKALLDAKADPNLRALTFHAGEYQTLMAAMNRCNKDWEKILDAMIAAGGEVNPKEPFSTTPLIYAIARYDSVMVKALIAKGADVNLKTERGTTPLMTAVMSEGLTVEIVKLLLAAGADPNARDNEGKTALTFMDIYVKEKTERTELLRLLRSPR